MHYQLPQRSSMTVPRLDVITTTAMHEGTYDAKDQEYDADRDE